MKIYTPEDIAGIIADNAKSNKWLSSSFNVITDKGTFTFGVKAYGKWVQRIECCGMADGVAEQKTLKALKVETVKLINNIVKGL